MNCISLIGKGQAGSFFADGNTGRWRNTRTIKVTGYGSVPTPTASGQLETITINGFSFGTGRIVSVEKNGGDEFGAKGLGNQKFEAVIETFIDGDISLTNLPVGSITNLSYLESFTEDFNVGVDEQGNYKYTHNLKIKYLKAAASFDPINTAKVVANNIYNGTAYESQITSLGKTYGYNRGGRKFYNESYNLITNECSFQKTYTLLNSSNPNTDYTANITNKITINENGITEVAEQGRVIGLNGYDSAKNAVEVEIGASYDRCNQLFVACNGYLGGVSDALVNEPVEKTKTFNQGAEAANYTVSYSNARSIEKVNSFSFEQVTTYTKDADVTNLNIDGRIRSFRKKGTNFDGISLYNQKVPSTPSGYKLKSKTVSMNKRGKEVNFQYSYTNDPSLLEDGIFRKISVDIQDKPGELMHKEYPIPNALVLVQNLGQVALSTRSVTVNTILARTPGQNVMTSPPSLTSALQDLKGRIVSSCLKVYTDLLLQSRNPKLNMAFFTNNTFAFDSGRNLKMGLELQYVVSKSSLIDRVIS